MLKYYIECSGQGPEDAEELCAKRVHGRISDEPEEFAEQAAEYCQNYRDGWEWSWPKLFVIMDDGKEVGRFNVEREHIPTFSASPAKPNAEDDSRRARSARS